MQFTVGTALLALASFLGTVSAQQAEFSIYGSGVPGNSFTLTALNGQVGDKPPCSGTVKIGGLPASGTIPCDKDYALAFDWKFLGAGGISANFTTPSTPLFIYNLPYKSFDGQTYEFGFTDYFKTVRDEKMNNPGPRGPSARQMTAREAENGRIPPHTCPMNSQHDHCP